MKISGKIKMKAKVKPDLISIVKIILRLPVNIEVELKDAEVNIIK